jgi:hypothetical protein
MIRHTVAFRLKHTAGAKEEASFLQAAQGLARIPTVKSFECLRQTGRKNNFAFGLSMEFDDEEAYRLYNEHPEHVAFVQTRWIPEVVEFIELDYQPLDGPRIG